MDGPLERETTYPGRGERERRKKRLRSGFGRPVVRVLQEGSELGKVSKLVAVQAVGGEKLRRQALLSGDQSFNSPSYRIVHRWGFLGGKLKQFRHADMKGLGQFGHVVERDIPFPSFNPPDIRGMEVGSCPQLFLRRTLSFAQFPQPLDSIRSVMFLFDTTDYQYHYSTLPREALVQFATARFR